MANSREDAVAVARSQLGVKEVPPRSNRTPFGAWYGWNGVAWCAIFLSWVLAHVGNRTGYRFASTAASVAWARRAGRLIPLAQAQPGDVLVHLYSKTTGHTGLFVRHEPGGRVRTIEGNTAAGNDRDGGQVQERVRSGSWWPYVIRVDFDDQPSPVPAPAPAPQPAPQPPHVPPFPGTTRRGSRGAAVRQVQQRLRDRGWSIAVDGDFGPATDRVVRAFQQEKRLTVDGIVGPQTWSALWSARVT